MKAAQIDAYGGPETVTIRDVPTPQLKPGQVLVKVHAASLNPFDTKLREGMMRDSIAVTFPYTPGGDFAGTVVTLGGDVTDVAIGQRVYGQASAISGATGSLAEYAAVQPAQLATASTGLSLTDIAGLPLVAVSALQALTEHIGLQAGQRIFINGGTGGIGAIALQLAKHLGAYVAVTATGDGIAEATQLGADEVIDYRTEKIQERLHDYDAVFDTVGNDFDAMLKILKPGGEAVSMVASADPELASSLQIHATTQGTRVTSDKLRTIASYVEDGIIHPNVGAVFSLDEAREAFRAREAGGVAGKVVIAISE